MISKANEGSNIKTSIEKLMPHLREYAQDDAGGIINIDVTNVIYFLFKIINPATIIVVSNLKYEIKKETYPSLEKI